MAPSTNDDGSYIIWIRNHSGEKANYALVAAPPIVEPPVEASHTSTSIITTFRNVPSGTSVVRFKLPKQMNVVCGTSLSDGGNLGSVLEVLDEKPIALGRHVDDGSVVAGSSLRMVVEDGQPAFGPEVAADAGASPEAGAAGAFCVQTSSDFTFGEAKHGGYIIGIHGPWSSLVTRRNVGLYSTFTPKPTTKYHIQPQVKFGLVAGDYRVRSRFDGATQGVCELDFAALGTDDVEVVHTSKNELVVAKQ